MDTVVKCTTDAGNDAAVNIIACALDTIAGSTFNTR